MNSRIWFASTGRLCSSNGAGDRVIALDNKLKVTFRKFEWRELKFCELIDMGEISVGTDSEINRGQKQGNCYLYLLELKENC